ncbi:MAG: DUF2088 domain-containing protein [Myxococcales bacterium]|nr:DUF2088 domain-containing protein [Myxococcales bacterium]
MATIRLRYGHEELEARLDGPHELFAPAGVPEPELGVPEVTARLVAAGLDAELARARSIAIVASDQTRKGGMRVTLEALAGLLARAAVAPERVTLVVAYGLHARQSDEVSRAIYGDAVLARARLVHHDARDPAGLEAVGVLPGGGELRLARAVARAELRILCGAVGFHYYAGFSGGRKAILPGVADEASIVRNHLRVLDPAGPGGRAAGCGPARLAGNPVSEEMQAALRLWDARGGVTFLANAVVDVRGAIVELACGAAHERAFVDACAGLVARHAVRLDAAAPFDCVVASAGGHPYDASLYQAHKAYDNAFRAVGPAAAGGLRPSIVLVARCPEGLGHPGFARWLLHPTRAAHYAALVAGYEIVGQTSLAVRDKAAATRTIAVTELDDASCRAVGWERADSLAEALARATPGRTRIALMPAAAQTLPLDEASGVARFPGGTA